MNKEEVKMTEKQFIAKFKKAGFELYKTREVRKKLKALEKIGKILDNL